MAASISKTISSAVVHTRANCAGAVASSSPAAVCAARPCRVPAVNKFSGQGSRKTTCRIAAASNGVLQPTSKPVVRIDNVSDPFATVLTVEFGDKPGELLETITALKNLNLNIRRAKLAAKNQSSTFYITDADTSEKLVRSARLEEIRLTVLNSLASGAEESQLTAKANVESDTVVRPLGVPRKVVQTTIDVSEADNGSCSVLKIKTSDRPGLLVDIVKVLKDINLNVVSAEVDTVGDEADDEFFVTYHGEPLTSPMVLLVTNALQYYLSLAEVAKEESY